MFRSLVSVLNQIRDTGSEANLMKMKTKEKRKRVRSTPQRPVLTVLKEMLAITTNADSVYKDNLARVRLTRIRSVARS